MYCSAFSRRGNTQSIEGSRSTVLYTMSSSKPRKRVFQHEHLALGVIHCENILCAACSRRGMVKNKTARTVPGCPSVWERGKSREWHVAGEEALWGEFSFVGTNSCVRCLPRKKDHEVGPRSCAPMGAIRTATNIRPADIYSSVLSSTNKICF